MLELTHVHVLFRNSHFANDFNFNVNEPVRVEVEVKVDSATSLISPTKHTHRPLPQGEILDLPLSCASPYKRRSPTLTIRFVLV